MSASNPSRPLGLTVAVMAYNEEASLEPVVQEIMSVLKQLPNSYEMVIIDDGSVDATGRIADRLAATEARLRVIHHPANQGLGAVYRDGFYCGTLDAVTLFPADGQFTATIIPEFLSALGDCDMVLGYVPDFGRQRTLLARFMSFGERMLFHGLFGHFPKFQGIMMFRRALLDSIPLVSSGRGWMVQMEIILRVLRAGKRVANLPTTLRPRMSGQSKVNNFRSIFSNLWQIVELRFRL